MVYQSVDNKLTLAVTCDSSCNTRYYCSAWSKLNTKMGLHTHHHPPQTFGPLREWWWLKATLVFCFGPNWTVVLVLGIGPLNSELDQAEQ